MKVMQRKIVVVDSNRKKKDGLGLFFDLPIQIRITIMEMLDKKSLNNLHRCSFYIHQMIASYQRRTRDPLEFSNNEIQDQVCLDSHIIRVCFKYQ